MIPTTLLLLAAGVLAAGVTDWGALARGASSLLRSIAKRERFKVRADWRLVLTGPDGRTKDVRTFKNLVVNAGLDLLKDRMFNPGTAAAVVGHLGIGTGAVPETAVDVALGGEVARGAVTYTPGGTGVCVVERTFPAAGGYEPAAITEAGLFDAPAAGTLFSRKTFPAVNKTAPDTLKVTVTLTITPA